MDKNLALQVGALLHLNSALPADPRFGHKAFDLDGSCVLLDGESMLGIAHTVEHGASWHWVFLHGQGIFEVEVVSEQGRGKPTGDRLVLFRLKNRGISLTPGRPYAWIGRDNFSRVRVAGFGTWSQAGVNLASGIFRQFDVTHAGGHDEDVDNLDLAWEKTPNGDLAAGRDNSGGAMHISEPGELDGLLTGILREVTAARCIGTRIAETRRNWLATWMPILRGEIPAPLRSIGEPSFAGRVLGRGERQQVFTLPIPPGARGARITLSATAGRRLQMASRQGSPFTAAELAALASTYGQTGRFLFRPTPVTADAGTLQVAVTTVDFDLELAEVEIQLCVLFETSWREFSEEDT